MNLLSPPLQRAQLLFGRGVSADEIIDELRDEFALDAGTAIAATATAVLLAAQAASTVDESFVRPFLA